MMKHWGIMTKKYAFLIGLTITLVAFWFGTPIAIRAYLNGKPGVTVTKVEIVAPLRGGVLLTGVTVDRGWLKGSFPKVYVWRDTKQVHLQGGSLNIALSQKPKGAKGDEKSDGYLITGEDLEVYATYEKSFATLGGVRLGSQAVVAETVSGYHPRGDFDAKGVTFTRTGSQVLLDSGEFTPRGQVMGHTLGKVSFQKVTAQNKTLKVGSTTTSAFGAHLAAVGMKVEQTPEGILGTLESLVVCSKQLHADHQGNCLPTTFKSIEVGPVVLDKLASSDQRVRVDSATLHFNLEKRRVWGAETCSAWFSALPTELKAPTLLGSTYTGNFDFDLELKPEVKLRWNLGCKSTVSPAVASLKDSFQYQVGANGETSRVSGSKTKDWVPLQEISPNVITALLTTEDGAFFLHHGFIREALVSSIAANLKAEKPLRGGSTLTMQLAKNLWLARSKTIGRKVQEAFLTIDLESHLSKFQILELYLNVVEFGPDLYGIGPATKKLLDTTPMRLTLTESLFLTLRLPSPRRAGPLDAAKRSQINRLITGLATSGKIPEDLATVEMSTE